MLIDSIFHKIITISYRKGYENTLNVVSVVPENYSQHFNYLSIQRLSKDYENFKKSYFSEIDFSNKIAKHFA